MNSVILTAGNGSGAASVGVAVGVRSTVGAADGGGVVTSEGVGITSAVAVGMEVGAVSGAEVTDGLTDEEHAASSPARGRAINTPVRVLVRIGRLPGRLVGS